MASFGKVCSGWTKLKISGITQKSRYFQVIYFLSSIGEDLQIYHLEILGWKFQIENDINDLYKFNSCLIIYAGESLQNTIYACFENAKLVMLGSLFLLCTNIRTHICRFASFYVQKSTQSHLPIIRPNCLLVHWASNFYIWLFDRSIKC